MAKNCNGYIRDSLELYEPDEGTSGNLSSEFEKIFRGFEKVPIVICQRCDLKPYLNKMELDLPPDVSETKHLDVEPLPAISNLLKECSVLLERQNLKELKELYTNNWKENQLNNVKLKCNICQKIFLSEKKLQNHQENNHNIFYRPKTKSRKRVSFSDTVIIHEVKKYHKCQKCPKIFEHHNLLKSHMKHIHKKRRCYICFYCSKDFIDRTFFKVHIKLHCDSCGLLLPDKKEYLEHRRTICKTVKKYECKTCHIILFHLMDLRDHSYEHSGSIFICDLCKEKFETKCEIKHHIRFLHSKSPSSSIISARKNGIDRVYLSNCCNARDKDKELVEKHISVFPDQETSAMTNPKVFYFCDQCYEKFNTETEMLQHKWTHFLKSDENRKSPQENLIPAITYNIHEKLPSFLQPKLILERIVLPEKKLEGSFNFAVTNFNLNGQLKKPIVDPVTKKTIISRHQCEKCGKYLSSNYCLTRHMLAVHGVRKDHGSDGMQCHVCEEMVWPQSQSHRCFRMSNTTCMIRDQNSMDQYIDLTHINDAGDYMNRLDYEIPEPIVELTEYENENIYMNGNDGRFDLNSDKECSLNTVKYKIVVQEVPIEFE